MDLQFPSSPRPDLVAPPLPLAPPLRLPHSPAPPPVMLPAPPIPLAPPLRLPHSLAPPPAMLPAPPLRQPDPLEPGEERWFFNMKVHSPPAHNYPHPQRRAKQLGPMSRVSRGGRGSQVRTSRDQGRAAKPLFNRHRKLEAMATPSPAELRKQIETQAARSIGDSLIFHNIPQRREGAPEAEVARQIIDF